MGAARRRRPHDDGILRLRAVHDVLRFVREGARNPAAAAEGPPPASSALPAVSTLVSSLLPARRLQWPIHCARRVHAEAEGALAHAHTRAPSRALPHARACEPRCAGRRSRMYDPRPRTAAPVNAARRPPNDARRTRPRRGEAAGVHAGRVRRALRRAWRRGEGDAVLSAAGHGPPTAGIPLAESARQQRGPTCRECWHATGPARCRAAQRPGTLDGCSRGALGVLKEYLGAFRLLLQNVVVPPLIAKVDSALMVPDVGTNVPLPPAPPAHPRRRAHCICRSSRALPWALRLSRCLRGGVEAPAVSRSAPLRVSAVG